MFFVFNAKSQYLMDFETETDSSLLFLNQLSNPGGTEWQIGQLNKGEMQGAYSQINVIVTDTIDFYGINDTVFFEVRQRHYSGFDWGNNGGIHGYYWVESDSLNDFGRIEVSLDNKQSWINILEDTLYESSFYWTSDKPVLTGRSKGWNYFGVALNKLGDFFSIPEFVYYRFSFISDSIPDSLGGLAFDYMFFEHVWEGIDERGGSWNLNIFPNPTSSTIRISSNQLFSSGANEKIYVYSSLGEQIMNVDFQTELDVSSLGPGMYVVKILDDDGRTYFGRFVKE